MSHLPTFLRRPYEIFAGIEKQYYEVVLKTRVGESNWFRSDENPQFIHTMVGGSGHSYSGPFVKMIIFFTTSNNNLLRKVPTCGRICRSLKNNKTSSSKEVNIIKCGSRKHNINNSLSNEVTGERPNNKRKLIT